MTNTLLIIGYVWPEPQSSAAGSHMISIIRLFRSANWRVIFATPAQHSEYDTDLSTENIESISIELNDSSFDRYLEELQPHLVLFDRFLMEEQFGWRVAESSPNTIRILDTEDLQCLRNARHQALKENRQFDSNSDLASDLAKREIASIYRCDLSLIISDFELKLLIEQFKIDPNILIHLPFMLSAKLLSQDRMASNNEFSRRQHFVTVGNFRHAPNWDSVLYLQKIWPKIRQQIPTAQMHIYGAYAPPKATALNNPKIGFLIKDRAADVSLVMKNARVCLSPLRFGAGIKGKFIDAMLNGTPSVTTCIGEEGMTGEYPWPGLVADNTEKIVAAAIRLYQDESLWHQKSKLCCPLLNGYYNGEKNGFHLLNRVSEIQANLKQHRNNNFIGSLLSFHSMRSTKYMSRWIEEKNRNSDKLEQHQNE